MSAIVFRGGRLPGPPGAHADLLVADGNPLRDLGAFQDGGPRLAAVMKAGRFVKNTL